MDPSMKTEKTPGPHEMALVKVPGELVIKVFRVVETLGAQDGGKQKKAVKSLLKAAAKL